MGIWGGIDPMPLDYARIAEEMRPALASWFNGRLKFYDPKTYPTSSHYDPNADTGGTNAPVLVLDTGAGGALIQPIRQAVRLELGAQASDLVGIRFQIVRSSTLLRGGLTVEVIDGGEAPELVNYTFQLQEAIDSSLAWGRILEATVMTNAVV